MTTFNPNESKEKSTSVNKLFLTIPWYIGLTAFVGGWLIFITWTTSRYFFAFDFYQLEVVGFIWIIVFFWLCLFAFGLLFIYIILNRKSLHRKMLYTALIILINIPSVLYILDAQSRIGNFVFVKLQNESGKECEQLVLRGQHKSWDIGGLDVGSSMVFHYGPDLMNADARFYATPDTLKLILKHRGKNDTLDFPKVDLGSCESILLDEKLKLHSFDKKR
jgi:hypothetical protein